MKYRPDIDGLRAIAVTAVVAFHAFPNLARGGFVGVDVFFVISGFLISRIILEAHLNNSFSYLDFYARRIKRIFPALIVVSAFVFALGWYVLLPDEFRQLGKHLAAGAGFVSNFALWHEAGYFDRSADTKPLLHLWSLGIEEQFYILWPVVLSLALTLKRGFILVAATLALASFAFNIVTTANDPVAAFYSPLTRFWELMVGGILAYLVVGNRFQLTSFANTRVVLGLSMIIASVLFLNKEMAFPGYLALLPTVGAFLIISGDPGAWLNRHLLGNRLMVGVGLISYPLYLWHWPLLVFFKIIKGRLLTPLDRTGAVALAVVLAFLTYRFIERPFRGAWRRDAPAYLATGMAIVAVLGIAVFANILASRLRNENVEQILAASYDWEYPPVAARNRSFGDVRHFDIPNNSGLYTLFIGDSNMEQYGPRIDKVIKENPKSNGAIMVGNQHGCALLEEVIAAKGRCPEKMAQLKTLIEQESTRAITFAASWLNYPMLLDPENQDRFVDFISQIDKTKSVYIILNIPYGEELAPANMFEGSRLSHIVPKPSSSISFDMRRFRERVEPLHEALRSIARKSRAVTIDPTLTLCPDDHCAVFNEAGAPNYLDIAHLNRSYTRSSATYIDATLVPGAARVDAP